MRVSSISITCSDLSRYGNVCGSFIFSVKFLHLKQKESNSGVQVWCPWESYGHLFLSFLSFLSLPFFLSEIFSSFLFVFDIPKRHHNVSLCCFPWLISVKTFNLTIHFPLNLGNLFSLFVRYFLHSFYFSFLQGILSSG